MMEEVPGDEPELNEALQNNISSPEVLQNNGSSPEPPDSQEFDGIIDIRILTLNFWGITLISKDRLERLDAICEQICSSPEPYQFVMLQEVWNNDDYGRFSEKLKHCLPYSHYFHSGVIGSGLCMFSATPIVASHFYPWSVNGLPHKILHGDWWGGKGVAFCSTQYKGHKFMLCTTHLHAVYHHLRDEYLHHRVVQAFETSQALKWCCPNDHTVILAGDLNCEPQEVPYRVIRHNASLRDAFVEAPNKPVDGVGATCETPGNSYTSVAALRIDPTGKRIDHILYRPAEGVKAKVKLCDLPWPLRVPGKPFSFSDHEAVRAVLQILPEDAIDSVASSGALSLQGLSSSTLIKDHQTGDKNSDNNDTYTALSGLQANGKTALLVSVNPGSQAQNKSLNSSSTASTRARRKQELLQMMSTVQEETSFLHQQTDTLLDSAAICTQGLHSITTSRNFYRSLLAAFVVICSIFIIILCNNIGESNGMSGSIVFLLLLLLLLSTLISVYCIWLIFVWNRIECNAILATKLSIECLLEDLRKKNAEQFKRTNSITCKLTRKNHHSGSKSSSNSGGK